MKCMCLFAQKETKDINDPFYKEILFFFFFFAIPRGLRDLSSHPGIEPAPLAVKVQHLNHRLTRVSPKEWQNSL